MTSFSHHPHTIAPAIRSMAQEMVKNQAPDLAPSGKFSPAVNVRLTSVQATAEASVQKADRKAVADYLQLLSRARNATKTGSRVTWLTEAADRFSDAHKANSACKKGCAHCCHIPVSIGEVEAALISKATGKKVTPTNKHVATPEIGVPCTFLKGNTCSIYSARPVICRVHMSMDQDDLLCRLESDGTSIPVPYANNLDIVMETFVATGPQYADIRQWFPSTGN